MKKTVPANMTHMTSKEDRCVREWCTLLYRQQICSSRVKHTLFAFRIEKGIGVLRKREQYSVCSDINVMCIQKKKLIVYVVSTKCVVFLLSCLKDVSINRYILPNETCCAFLPVLSMFLLGTQICFFLLHLVVFLLVCVGRLASRILV